jgi:hypothetical protein
MSTLDSAGQPEGCFGMTLPQAGEYGNLYHIGMLR